MPALPWDLALFCPLKTPKDYGWELLLQAEMVELGSAWYQESHARDRWIRSRPQDQGDARSRTRSADRPHRVGAGRRRGRSRAAGFDHHLVKPPDVDKLRDLLTAGSASPPIDGL